MMTTTTTTMKGPLEESIVFVSTTGLPSQVLAIVVISPCGVSVRCHCGQRKGVFAGRVAMQRFSLGRRTAFLDDASEHNTLCLSLVRAKSKDTSPRAHLSMLLPASIIAFEYENSIIIRTNLRSSVIGFDVGQQILPYPDLLRIKSPW
jgi:hypothetical protein